MSKPGLNRNSFSVSDKCRPSVCQRSVSQTYQHKSSWQWSVFHSTFSCSCLFFLLPFRHHPFPVLPPVPPPFFCLTLQEEEKTAPSPSKKPGKGRPSLGREKSADSSSTSSSASAEKQRQEARKRLLAAKKAASFRQNSATESADSIEIYVPEAQTRLWESTTQKRRDLSQISVIDICHEDWEELWLLTSSRKCGAGQKKWSP